MSAFTKCFSKNRPCNYCGKTIKEDRRIKQERVYCNRECQHKWLSENFSGENNPQWIDGNKERYRGENWYRSRRTVIKRDDGKCRLCGSSFTICVHHITPIREYQVPEDANNLENLVCLCKSCHQKTEPRQGKINMLNERLRNENFAIYHW